MSSYPKRGDIYWVNLDPTVGSEIRKTRPGVIISTNAANEVSGRIIVAPITSKVHKIFPFEVKLEIKGVVGKVLLDQIRALDKVRLGSKISTCNTETMKLIDEALKIALSLT
jgi:mRNA interferase MazF